MADLTPTYHKVEVAVPQEIVCPGIKNWAALRYHPTQHLIMTCPEFRLSLSERPPPPLNHLVSHHSTECHAMKPMLGPRVEAIKKVEDSVMWSRVLYAYTAYGDLPRIYILLLCGVSE